MGRKRNKVYQLALVALLLAACAALMAGTVLARYRWNDNFYLSYGAGAPEDILLWSGYVDSSGTLLEGVNSWTVAGDGSAALSFVASNGTEDSFAQEDRTIALRLLVSAAAGESLEDWSVSLYLEGSEALYTARFIPIGEDTLLYKSFGPGYVYIFYDEYDRELAVTLPGGELSLVEGAVEIEGLQLPGDAALIQLQVVSR